jgi:two-component system, OmpR family, sensor kinase
VGIVGHRAELVEAIGRNAAEQGRRALAEELITVLAHDLRNHIAPIDLRLARLERSAEREERPSDLRDAELARGGLERLGAIIADILDVARLEHGMFRAELAPLSLSALVVETAASFATPEHPIDVRTAEDVVVAGDAQRLRQCLENLLHNAIGHSPAGAAVTVFVSAERGRDGERGRVDVIDEGPGVPQEMRSRVFDRFVSGATRNGGLGLGLYLAKRIAAIHGGDLTLESPPGRGAHFTLTVPTVATH